MEKKSLNDMQKEEHLGSSLRICRVQKYLRWPSFTPFLDILLSYETFRASYLMDSSDFRPSRRDERERERAYTKFKGVETNSEGNGALVVDSMDH